MTDPIPEEVAALVAGFRPAARAEGWHTHRGSSGRCWLIARAFAEHVKAHGGLAELYAVESLTATRPADLRHSFAVVDGWAVDFASRGRAGDGGAPWPVVRPLAAYLARCGPRLPMCPTCGSTGDVGPDLVRLPMDRHSCPGLLPMAEHLERLRQDVEREIRAALASPVEDASPGRSAARLSGN